VIKQIKSAFYSFVFLTVVTGAAYPLLVTFSARIFFPEKAGGSIIIKNGKAVGSSLIGQNFEAPEYFWGRLSATAGSPYNPSCSSGSNLGPANVLLKQRTLSRVKAFMDFDAGNKKDLPVDLATASASGLDPHISVAGALYQAKRIASFRQIPEDKVIGMIKKHTAGRFLGIIGEPSVNVLELNLDLDDYKKEV